MLHGLSGTLLTHEFVERELPRAFAGRLDEEGRERAAGLLRRWWWTQGRLLGPVSRLRTLVDSGAAPLLAALEWEVRDFCLEAPGGPGLARLVSAEGGNAALLVGGWGSDAGRAWHEAVREGIRQDARWCYVFTGDRLRIVDARRTYARQFLEFDLEAAGDDPDLAGLIWTLGRAATVGRPAAGTGPAALGDIVEASDRFAAGVGRSLRAGVESALKDLAGMLVRQTPRPVTALAPVIFDGALTIVYRLLFLLFAEARGLVPTWNPVYRDSYTIASLRSAAVRGDRAAGLWEGFQAITRLARRGCEAGDLRVTAFNGRLFAAGGSPGLEAARRRRRRTRREGRDETMRRVLLALTTRAGPDGREDIAFGDLGVEQLGAVYEQVLDYAPAWPAPGAARRPDAIVSLVRTGRRKRTGSYYTPRSITDFLVRRALHPLVAGRQPEKILELRVLDPAMGSGAFLVSACRYLAAAYEQALVRSGAAAADDVSEDDRAAFRRAVAQRCLYGVDRNPTAVQLGRLSLWLATLASDRPLTFLDHNLRVGDSLVGASVADLARQPPPSRGRARRRPAPTPLFEGDELAHALGATVAPRLRLGLEPGDTLAAVRDKEAVFARVSGPSAPLSRWRAVADLWCAAAFWPADDAPPGTGEFWTLVDTLLGGGGDLPGHVAAPRLRTASRLAAEQGCFHWTLEFPEVFVDGQGRPLDLPGFDAVLGNPPWEMVRADDGDAHERHRARAASAALLRFARASGIYGLQGDGHANLYQLFLERSLALMRRGGRMGLVMPAGLATDRGSAVLRRHLLTRCRLDTLWSFDNRDGLFPIHRGVRFLLVTATAGGETTRLWCRFGNRSLAALDATSDAGVEPGGASPVELTPALLHRLSGEQLAVPDLRSAADLAIVEKAASRARPLGEAAGWGARFGRELNATEDRPYFVPAGQGLPVLEGKHLRPFVAAVELARRAIPEAVAARRLRGPRPFSRARLAFRDVASATNERSLIAAIVPAGVVTVHTLQCLKSDMGPGEQACLCALLNSYVANYLVRLRMGTHVTAWLAEAVPMPRPATGSPAFAALASLAGRLAAAPEDERAEARLQAIAASLYGLTRDEFAHVLGTFPLIDAARRQRALAVFGAD